MVRPGLEFCKPTGAQILEGGMYLLMSDDGGIGKALEKEIKKRKAQVLLLDPVADREQLEKQLQELIARQPSTAFSGSPPWIWQALCPRCLLRNGRPLPTGMSDSCTPPCARSCVRRKSAIPAFRYQIGRTVRIR